MTAGVGVVIFGGIEFCRHALDQLQSKINFVRHELFVDRQAELVSSADFRGRNEGYLGSGRCPGLSVRRGFRVSETTGKEVPAEEIVRGFEDDELKEAAPEKSAAIEIQEFVNESHIPTLYFEKPYYLEPDKRLRSTNCATPTFADLASA
jgi:hypothetical protein